MAVSVVAWELESEWALAWEPAPSASLSSELHL